MKLLNKIEDILKNDFIKHRFQKKFSLKEIKSNTCEEIFISCNESILVCKFGEKEDEANVQWFKQTTIKGSPHAICDYVIFYELKAILHIFICELKSKNEIGKGKNQIDAGFLLARYIVDTAKRCLDIEEAQITQQEKTKTEVKFRGFLFSNRPMYKETNLKKEGINKPYKLHELPCGETYDLNSFLY